MQPNSQQQPLFQGEMSHQPPPMTTPQYPPQAGYPPVGYASQQPGASYPPPQQSYPPSNQQPGQPGAQMPHNDMFGRLFRSSFPLFTFKGIPVRMHSLFPVFFFVMLMFSTGFGGSYFAYVFMLFGPILLVTVFIHELGHSLMTRRIGGEVHGILLWPLGGLAFVGHASTPRQDLLVAVAGPATHVPMFLFWLILEVIIYRKVAIFSLPFGSSLGLALCAGAIAMQVVLFAFNLLIPAYPLDGGRVLADALLIMGFDENRAGKVSVFVSAPLAVGIFIFGLIYVQLTTMMIAVWILYSTWGLYKHVRDGTVKMHPLFNFDNEHNRRLLQDQV